MRRVLATILLALTLSGCAGGGYDAPSHHRHYYTCYRHHHSYRCY